MGSESALSHFYAAFAGAADRFADRIAVEVQGSGSLEQVRYRELRDRAERTAAWLSSRYIGRGARVAILADNDAHWCAAYLGVLRAGAAAVPLDTSYSVDQITTLLRDSGAAVVFAGPRHLAAAAGAAGAMTAPPEVVPLQTQTASVDPNLAACPATLSDPAVILYTSGTTSDPKGVVLTHGNLLSERAATFQIVGVTENDAVLSVLPLFHALAQMANLLLPFSAGARVVFLESVNTGELARALRERGITAFVCVPQFFYLLHRRIEEEINARPAWSRALVRLLAAGNLQMRRYLGLNPGRVIFGRVHRSVGPNLRLLITGGARFDPASNRALHALGFTIQQAYGLTECSGAATVTRPGDLHLEAVGQPLPGVELRIETGAGGADGEQRDGEVWIRGPIVMAGYFNRPEQNAITLAGGWLHTGDLGYQDPDGRLCITGRSKEVIVLGSGKNIYPEEIETHYERSPFIQELCVVGRARPGEPSAERLHALVRPDLGAMQARGIVNIRELLRFEIEGLSVQLPAHKRILGYDITLDPLPRTTTRKLKRFAVERLLSDRETADAQAATGAPAAPGGEDASDPVAARILAEMRHVIRADVPLASPSHLELDVGLDSMERVELLVHLTTTFGVEIADEEAQALHTVGDLVEALRSRIGVLPAEREITAPWARLLERSTTDDPVIAGLDKPSVLIWILFAIMKLVHGACRITIGLRATGRVHLPASGPYLICPNHQSYIDPLLVVAVLPYRAFRNLFFVGAAEYFQTPLTRRLARALNVVPIDPDANLVDAMKVGAEGLRRGKVLVLFPEGERSIDGTVKAFRKGAAILSHHLAIPVVPVAIDGVWAVWPRGQAFNWRAWLPWSRTRASVAFGRPLPPGTQPDYIAQSEALRQAVLTMWESLHASRAGSTIAEP